MSFLTALAPTLLGGLFSRSAAKSEHELAVDDQVKSIPRLVESARKAGINPLTALGSSAASSFGQTGAAVPAFASVAALTGMAQSLDDEASGRRARRDKADQLAVDLAQVRLDQAKAEDKARMAAPKVGVPAKKSFSGNGGLTSSPRPLLRMRPLSEGPHVRVYDPFGDVQAIAKPTADRLRLEEGDQMIMEDLEGVISDGPAGVAAVTRIEQVHEAANLPFIRKVKPMITQFEKDEMKLEEKEGTETQKQRQSIRW